MPYIDEVFAEEQEVWMSVREGLGFDLPPDPFTIPCRASVFVDVAAVLCELVRAGRDALNRRW